MVVFFFAVLPTCSEGKSSLSPVLLSAVASTVNHTVMWSGLPPAVLLNLHGQEQLWLSGLSSRPPTWGSEVHHWHAVTCPSVPEQNTEPLSDLLQLYMNVIFWLDLFWLACREEGDCCMNVWMWVNEGTVCVTVHLQFTKMAGPATQP